MARTLGTGTMRTASIVDASLTRGNLMKKPYTEPTITDVGSVAELTLGQAQGSKLDASFSAGTALPDLTFS